MQWILIDRTSDKPGICQLRKIAIAHGKGNNTDGLMLQSMLSAH